MPKQSPIDSRTKDFLRAMAFLFILLLLLVIFGRCASSNNRDLEYITSVRLTIDRLWNEAYTAHGNEKISTAQLFHITSSLNELTTCLNSTQDIVEWGQQGLIDKRHVKEFMSDLHMLVDIVVQSIERVL